MTKHERDRNIQRAVRAVLCAANSSKKQKMKQGSALSIRDHDADKWRHARMSQGDK